ncbi:MAG: hypothetical protein IKA74_05595 [Clostridia bacterium]|nr:hypothetical protein [Clostridia bacterium]
MTITENAAYLKGLSEGLNLDTAKPEGKLIGELINIVSDMADAIKALEEENQTLRDYIEEIDEDLGDVEEYLCEECGCECEDDECECDGNCTDCDLDCDCDDIYEVVCPSCGETVCFDESIDVDDFACPACGEKISCDCDD